MSQNPLITSEILESAWTILAIVENKKELKDTLKEYRERSLKDRTDTQVLNRIIIEICINYLRQLNKN